MGCLGVYTADFVLISELPFITTKGINLKDETNLIALSQAVFYGGSDGYLSFPFL